MTDETFLTPGEAAARLGISPRQLSRRIAAGTVPCVRSGDKGWRRFRESDIDAIVRGGGLVDSSVRYEIRCAHENGSIVHASTETAAWGEWERLQAGERTMCQPWTVHEISTITTARQLNPEDRHHA